MSIAQFDGPPSWSVNANETGESTTSTNSRKIGDCEQSILSPE